MLKVSLTVEELGLCLMLCGYEDIAAGVVKPTLGEKSDSEWEVIFETASHSLLLKGLWDINRQRNEQIPLKEEMIAFINLYVESKKTVRLTKESINKTPELLILHYIEDNEWILHYIFENVCHEFSIVSNSQLQEIINSFYGINKQMLEVKEKDIKVSEKLVEVLSNEKYDEHEILKISSSFSGPDLEIFNDFLEDLKDNQFINNISVTHINNKNEFPELLDVLFILPIEKKLWLISQHDDEIGRPIYLINSSYSIWNAEIARRLNYPIPIK